MLWIVPSRLFGLASLVVAILPFQAQSQVAGKPDVYVQLPGQQAHAPVQVQTQTQPQGPMPTIAQAEDLLRHQQGWSKDLPADSPLRQQMDAIERVRQSPFHYSGKAVDPGGPAGLLIGIDNPAGPKIAGFAVLLGAQNRPSLAGTIAGYRDGPSCHLKISYDSGAGEMEMTGNCDAASLSGTMIERVGKRQLNATFRLTREN